MSGEPKVNRLGQVVSQSQLGLYRGEWKRAGKAVVRPGAAFDSPCLRSAERGIVSVIELLPSLKEGDRWAKSYPATRLIEPSHRQVRRIALEAGYCAARLLRPTPEVGA
jgi:hypothetical protein